MLQLQNLLCVVILLFLVSPLYGMKESKNEANLEVNFGYDEEYKENVKALLKQRYDDDVDKGKEAYRCHKCVFVFSQEKMFWVDYEHLCYECLYRFLPKTNMPFGLQFRFQDFDVDIAQILQNEMSFKDTSTMPQIFGHGILYATSIFIYYDGFIANLNDEDTKGIPLPITQLLQPIFFGYLYITSNIFAYQMYWPRIKNGEIPFSLSPCMKKSKNSKHLDNGYPGFQLFLGFLVFMLYLANCVDIAKWLLHIIMFGSAFSLWYGRNIGLNYFGRYFSVFHDLQPQKWASIACCGKSSQTIMRMAYLDEKQIFGKNFIVVSNQLIIFFNVVSSSILFPMLRFWSDVPSFLDETERQKNYRYTMVDLPINMGVWYTFIIFSIVDAKYDKKKPPFMTFNALLRFIVAGLYAAESTFENRYEKNIINFIFVIVLSFLLLIH